MKKILLLATLLVLLLFLAACGNTSVHTSTNTSKNTTAHLEKEIASLQENMVSKEELSNYTEAFLTEEEIKNMVVHSLRMHINEQQLSSLVKNNAQCLVKFVCLHKSQTEAINKL